MPECRDVLRLLPDYVENAGRASRPALERHLAGCPECAGEERALRRLRGLLRSLPQQHLAPERRTRLLMEFRKQRSASRRSLRQSPLAHSDAPDDSSRT